jgi:DNA-binding GntR family transcriptional regulator
MFEPLKQQTTPIAVHERLRRAILDGELPSGTQLREAHIAAEFQISRSPIREALGRLVEEGLVERVAFRGHFVARVSSEKIAEIAQFRVLVEPWVVTQARTAVLTAHQSEFRSRIERLDRATKGRDEPGMIDAHLSLHGLFYELCGNELIRQQWSVWESQLRLFFVADHRAFDLPEDVAHAHDRLVELIQDGTDDQICEAVRHHVHGAPGTEALARNATDTIAAV